MWEMRVNLTEPRKFLEGTQDVRGKTQKSQNTHQKNASTVKSLSLQMLPKFSLVGVEKALHKPKIDLAKI